MTPFIRAHDHLTPLTEQIFVCTTTGKNEKHETKYSFYTSITKTSRGQSVILIQLLNVKCKFSDVRPHGFCYLTLYK